MGDLERLSKAFSKCTKDHQDPFLRLKRQPSPEHKEELLTVVQRASASKCGDMRDRIYGVVAMSRSQDITQESRENVYHDRPMILDTDYSRNASQVYQDVIKYYVRSSGNLEIFRFLWGARFSLDHTTFFGGQVNGYRIPSWCPNFNMPWQIGHSRTKSLMISSEPYIENISKKKREENEAFFERSFTSEILHVRGIQLARVGDSRSTVHTDKDKPFITIHVDPWWRLKPAMKLQNVRIDRTLVIDSNDIVVAVDRAILLWILRPSKDRRCFTLVGVDRIALNELYVHDSWYKMLENNSHRFEECKIE
jgi:hypothetical protein